MIEVSDRDATCKAGLGGCYWRLECPITVAKKNREEISAVSRLVSDRQVQLAIPIEIARHNSHWARSSRKINVRPKCPVAVIEEHRNRIDGDGDRAIGDRQVQLSVSVEIGSDDRNRSSSSTTRVVGVGLKRAVAPS